MPYVIKRTDGKYVAVTGSPKSYTTKLERAQIYRSKEAARNDLCPENEYIVGLNHLSDD